MAGKLTERNKAERKWLVVTGKNSECLPLAKEACEFVIGGNQ